MRTGASVDIVERLVIGDAADHDCWVIVYVDVEDNETRALGTFITWSLATRYAVLNMTTADNKYAVVPAHLDPAQNGLGAMVRSGDRGGSFVGTWPDVDAGELWLDAHTEHVAQYAEAFMCPFTLL